MCILSAQDPVECVQGRFGTDTGINYFDQSLDYYNQGNITSIMIYHSEFIHGYVDPLLCILHTAGF